MGLGEEEIIGAKYWIRRVTVSEMFLKDQEGEMVMLSANRRDHSLRKEKK